MESIIQDLRYSIRMLMKHRAYTLIAVITLALGIGASAAIFSVVNSVLLRALPYDQGDPNALVQSLKGRIWESDKTQPFYAVTTMDQLVRDSLKARRFNLFLLGTLATLALALASVGIYGVMSFTTAQRTHEIGVRLALGAQISDIMSLVLGHGMALVLAGLVIGLLASFGLTRFLSNLLFNISPTDPLTFALISILLGGAALCACYVPARRATRIDPLSALK